MWFQGAGKRFRCKKYAAYFHCLDINNSGALDWEDFSAKARAVEAARGEGVGAGFEALQTAELALWREMISRMDEDGDGVISCDEFVGFYDTLAKDIAYEGELPAWMRAHLRALFGAVDHNGDGKIVLEEYALYLKVIGSGASADVAFAALDLNNDGLLDMDEVEQLFIEWVTSDDPADPGNVLVTGMLP